MPGPLADLTVLELAGIGPGPFAAMLLADLGASVLRVDRPGAPPSGPDLLADGRARLEVDLRSPGGAETVLGLVERADVLLEGFRPGVAERLGVGPQVCLARNPRLVFARMTGWGQQGPLAERAGHDINYLSLTGALHAIGPADRPAVPLNLVADFGGGSLFVVVGILAALGARTAEGGGQVVDAAMVDGASYLMGMVYRSLAAGGWQDERAVNLLDGGAPFYTTYACADGGHVAVGCLEPQFFAELVRVLGLDAQWLAAQHDRERWPALRAEIAAVLATRSRDAWAAAFAGTDACVTPVLSLREAPEGEHLAARGTFRRTPQGAAAPAPAPRFSATPTEAPGAAEVAATRQAFGLPPGG